MNRVEGKKGRVCVAIDGKSEREERARILTFSRVEGMIERRMGGHG